MSAKHTCVERCNKLLAAKNSRICSAIGVMGDERELILIKTALITKKRGARAVNLFATYCPFCGVKL